MLESATSTRMGEDPAPIESQSDSSLTNTWPKGKNMKCLVMLVVGSLVVACGSRGKSPSYAAQGERRLQLGGAVNRHSVEHSRHSARLMLAPEQTSAQRNVDGTY
jgi:hypothetical protein